MSTGVAVVGNVAGTGSVVYDFDNATNLAGEGLTVITQQVGNATAEVVTDKDNSNNKVVKLDYNTSTNDSGATNGIYIKLNNELGVLRSGTPLIISVRYKFLKDSVYEKANNGYYSFRGIEVVRGKEESGTVSFVPTYVDSGVYFSSANSVYNYYDESVTTASDRIPLSEDTEWLTSTFMYNGTALSGEKADHNQLYIRVSAESWRAIKKTIYIDDVTLSVLNGTPSYEINEAYNIDFKNADGTNWEPHSDAFLTGVVSGYDLAASSATNAVDSKVTDNGVQFQNVGSYRNHLAVYDNDIGGHFRLKGDTLYAITVKYKPTAVGTAGSIKLAYSTGTSSTFKKYYEPLELVNPVSKSTATSRMSLTNVHDLKYIAGSGQIGEFTTADVNKPLSFTAIVDTSDTSTFPNAANAFLYLTMSQASVSNPTTLLVESVDIVEVRGSEGAENAAVIKFVNNAELKDGKDNLPIGGIAGASAILPDATTTMVVDDLEKAFAGWYTDKELTKSVGADYKPQAGVNTLYAKWSTTYVNATFNNCGDVTTTKVARGTKLTRPQSPKSNMFFEGWYTGLDFTTKVTEITDDLNENVTLYAKFTYTYLSFDNGGISDKIHHKDVTVGIGKEPGTENGVAVLGNKGYSTVIELANYDDANAPIYKMPKTNTTYEISFKVKVPAGTPAGYVQLSTGETVNYDPNSYSKTAVAGSKFEWTADQGKDGIGWTTITVKHVVGDNFYRERKNFTRQDKFFITYVSKDADGVDFGSGVEGLVYLDDVMIGEFATEVPEGAVGIFYKTNAQDISPSFGYAGDRYTFPDNPTLSAHNFLGWYTDTNFTNKFTATTFPEKTVTLYAKWEKTDWICDYEYPYYVDGARSKRFFDITEPNGNNMILYSYTKGLEAGASDNLTSPDAAWINRSYEDFYTLRQGVDYTVTFKYKIEKVTTSGTISIIAHSDTYAWNNRRSQSATLKYEEATDGWQEGTLKFTANILNTAGNRISLGVSGNADIYFDDVKVDTNINFANLYGSSMVLFNTLGGSEVQAIAGDPGDKITLPADPVRSGYKFAGWYTDEKLTEKFTDTVFGEDAITTLYAAWTLGKFTESFEELPFDITAQGISGAYKVYDKTVEGFDKANVKHSATSIFRDGTKIGTKGFTICRDESLALGEGEQYTVTFYVKPTNVTDANGTINLIGMTDNVGVSTADSTTLIKNVSDLKVGEWNKITYTFTAKEPYIGISTSAGNDMYFDDFTVTLVGYTGSATGDTSVSPLVVMLMVILSAGALTVTGKKIFG
jgi:uncharacterized repeat protein (TIGR02543 family)